MNARGNGSVKYKIANVFIDVVFAFTKDDPLIYPVEAIHTSVRHSAAGMSAELPRQMLMLSASGRPLSISVISPCQPVYLP